MLYRAQIMLLDEPTNHLDVKNVAWLVNYLTTLTEVTSVIVSHDSTFLDNVCQSIVHYENRKLRIYKVRCPRLTSALHSRSTMLAALQLLLLVPVIRHYCALFEQRLQCAKCARG